MPSLGSRGAERFGGLLIGGIAVDAYKEITDDLLAASVDAWVFVADRAYELVGIDEIHSVVGGSGALVSYRKITAAGTAAPGAAAGATVKEFQSAALDLTTSINVKQAAALTSTAADLRLAVGDKIGRDMAGTLTGLVGKATLRLKPI